MVTGRHHSQSGRALSLRVPLLQWSIVEVGIDFGTGLEEELGYGHNIFWGFLAIPFHGVGSHIMEQSGPMLTLGTHPDELWISLNQTSELRQFPFNQRLDRRLELRLCRAFPIQRMDLFYELRPTLELMLSCNNELGIGQEHLSRLHLGLWNLITIVGIGPAAQPW